ncbi:MAG: TolC family protein [Gemmatimonadetes bacterium]|nr:TolC family protein [Gemmatimonadota bacterium]
MKTRMQFARWAGGAALIVTTLTPGTLWAQGAGARSVQLASFLREAEEKNPELTAARKAAEAAAARVPQAGALADPVVGVGVMNLPAADPGLRGDMMTMATVGVWGTLPFPGKLALREDAARFQAEASRWELERVRQKVVAGVKAAYYEIYFLDRALDVTARNQGLVTDFARLTSARYGVGTGAQADVLKAQVERTRLEDQLVDIREKRTSSSARLNSLLGRPTDTPVPAVEFPEGVRAAALQGAPDRATFAYVALQPAAAPGRPTVADLQRLALEHNPMIQAHLRRIEAQKKAVALAGKAKLPDFDISVGYGQRVGLGDFVSAMVSVPVPIFAGRKQDQQVAEEAASLAEMHALHDTMVNELNAEIASLTAQLERTRAQLLLLDQGILPQARAALASATAAYRVGRVDFLSLLDSQVTLYRHELDNHRLLGDFASILAALERAVGKEILP